MSVDHIPYTFAGSTSHYSILFVNCLAKVLAIESWN